MEPIEFLRYNTQEELYFIIPHAIQRYCQGRAEARSVMKVSLAIDETDIIIDGFGFFISLPLYAAKKNFSFPLQ
jgi:hypothetical protein